MTALFAIFCFGLAICGIVVLGLKNAAEVARREKIREKQRWEQRMQQRIQFQNEFRQMHGNYAGRP